MGDDVVNYERPHEGKGRESDRALPAAGWSGTISSRNAQEDSMSEEAAHIARLERIRARNRAIKAQRAATGNLSVAGIEDVSRRSGNIEDTSRRVTQIDGDRVAKALGARRAELDDFKRNRP